MEELQEEYFFNLNASDKQKKRYIEITNWKI